MNIAKVVSFRFQDSLIPFTMLIVEGPLKRDFLDIYLTTFFGIRNFGNTSAMRVTFLVKVFKILSTLQKCRKTLEKAFCFLDNYI